MASRNAVFGSRGGPGSSAGAQAVAEHRGDLTLAVGTLVVYGSYGIGRITDRRRRGRGPTPRETVVIEFAKSLSVTLPLERASACLRRPAGEAELTSVRNTLRSKESPDEDSWQRRTKAARSKIVTGDAVALAEVVRNAARRDGRATPGGGPGRLSAYERELYLEARQLLAAELGLSRGVDQAAAEAWIDDQLTHDGEGTPAVAT
jgi:RNA polymerase-interacting CarD/CdnL/TRCF family regulator